MKVYNVCSISGCHNKCYMKWAHTESRKVYKICQTHYNEWYIHNSGINAIEFIDIKNGQVKLC